MKRNFTFSIATLAFLFLSIAVKAQIYYNFDTPTPTSNSFSNITADTVRQGNNNGTTPVRTTTSPSSGYPGASGTFNAGAAVFTGGFNPATSTYFELTLTPTAGNSVVLTGISFGSRSTATGPQAATVRTSVDAFAADQATFVLAANSTWALHSSNLSVTGAAGTPVVIRIYGYNGAGNPGANTANWRIDDLTINPNTTLPVNLASFRGSLSSNKSVHLNWTTSNEQGLSAYIIERSNDGSTFTAVGNVAPTNRNSASYSFTDATPGNGINYYRLKITNIDGSSKLSSIVTISNRKDLTTSVFPNPAVGNLSVTHAQANKGATLRVLSLDGKLYKTFVVEQGAIQSALAINELVNGTYLLVFNNAGEVSSTKFIKQ